MSAQAPEKPARPVQPKCAECSHSLSFHGVGQGRCRALGCRCEGWKKPSA
jgi:hypothetical protein